MKKLIMLGLLVMLATSCSSMKKNINGKPQTFTEYVILNKYAENNNTEDGFKDFNNLGEESFPVNRYIKWKNN